MDVPTHQTPQPKSAASDLVLDTTAHSQRPCGATLQGAGPSLVAQRELKTWVVLMLMA